ncbi:MAG: aminoacyl-tRNA deacylase [Bacillota bacterium]
MRKLDQKNIEYKVYEYDISDGKIDGISVANKINKPLDLVYKTLVLKGNAYKYYVAVLPSDKELSFQKLCKITDEKKINFLDIDILKKKTGYVKGGCSPIAMKNKYQTFFSKDTLEKEKILVNAGKQGLLISINSNDLINFLGAEIKDICKKG